MQPGATIVGKSDFESGILILESIFPNFSEYFSLFELCHFILIDPGTSTIDYRLAQICYWIRMFSMVLNPNLATIPIEACNRSKLFEQTLNFIQ